ncbi:MAG: pyridoxal 5'-phosphate synthase glutaminase subunit PdxT [Euryarchaeota archaeon]|nr:pyridoxal 5'-phosphate synthase glutaminase subunit PdxT [Euryarchaeota archaeon]
MIRIGVLNLQGDVSEHLEITYKALSKINIDADVIKVKTASDVLKSDGLIISGGESMVIGKLIENNGLRTTIINQNIPIMGTCAGMVLLAAETDYYQPLLGLIDMKVIRNGFGRQKQSFEEEIQILGDNFKGIFIRAPYAEKVGKNVEVLAKLDDKIVAVKQGKYIATAFHPELTEDTKIHEYFIKEVLKCVE